MLTRPFFRSLSVSCCHSLFLHPLLRKFSLSPSLSYLPLTLYHSLYHSPSPSPCLCVLFFSLCVSRSLLSCCCCSVLRAAAHRETSIQLHLVTLVKKKEEKKKNIMLSSSLILNKNSLPKGVDPGWASARCKGEKGMEFTGME